MRNDDAKQNGGGDNQGVDGNASAAEVEDLRLLANSELLLLLLLFSEDEADIDDDDDKYEEEEDVDVEMCRSTKGLTIICSMKSVTHVAVTMASKTRPKTALSIRPPTLNVAQIATSPLHTRHTNIAYNLTLRSVVRSI